MAIPSLSMHSWSVSILFALVACGDDGGSSPDAGPADGSMAAFCDGTPRPIGQGNAREIAVDGEGRLLVLGTQFSPDQTAYVRRLLPSGELDAAFGDQGVATPMQGSDPHTFLVLPDDRILVGGAALGGGQQAPFLFELSPSGQLTGFEYREPETDQSRYVEYIATQGSDFVVNIGGTLHRLLATGTLDATFGAMDGGTPIVGDVAAAHPDGFTVASIGLELQTHRLDVDGRTPMSSLQHEAVVASRLVRVLANGTSAVIVGDARREQDLGSDLFITRLDAGMPDPTFGQDGSLIVDGGTMTGATDAHELSDGTILISGSREGNAVTRVNRDGSLGEGYPVPFYANAVAEWNGNWVVAGIHEQMLTVACGPL